MKRKGIESKDIAKNGSAQHPGAGAWMAVPLLLAFVALGCGEQKQQATAEPATTIGETPAAVRPAAVQTGTEGAAAAVSGEEAKTATEGTLPPDVVATAPDTLAIPGSIVVITALGSSDVTSVTLTDAGGEKTPFTYDSESNLWRVSYRVPVGASTEKIGLSVTATTEANRWKRVWVFLRLRGAVEEASSGPGC